LNMFVNSAQENVKDSENYSDDIIIPSALISKQRRKL